MAHHHDDGSAAGFLAGISTALLMGILALIAVAVVVFAIYWQPWNTNTGSGSGGSGGHGRGDGSGSGGSSYHLGATPAHLAA